MVLHYAVYEGWLEGAKLDDALVAAHDRHVNQSGKS